MSGIVTERLKIGGMTCVNCQTRIEKALRGTKGVKSAVVSYVGGYAEVTYDGGAVTSGEINAVIERAGYKVLSGGVSNVRRAVGLVIIIAALYLIASRLNVTGALPLAETGAGYGMLFVIGLLTSLHCVAMCGGICLTQTMGGKLRRGLFYNLGRVAGYTAVGAVVGAIGGVITFGGAFKGIVQLLAGVFMVVMGVNMLGIFPGLRKLTARLPRFKGAGGSPLVVGLLNGLMPCGPLQAMQLYALSTGSPVKGAAAMFLFSLGTVPLMFGLGALSSFTTKKFAHTAMTAGAVLVAVLGLTMFTQGAALSGFSFNAANGASDEAAVVIPTEAPTRVPTETPAQIPTEPTEPPAEAVQVVKSTLKSNVYPRITVQAGIPVRWVIDAPKGSITGCNKSLYISEYDLTYTFKTGENVIEFTPDKTGKFNYSCWMGMIKGLITVTEGSDG